MLCKMQPLKHISTEFTDDISERRAAKRGDPGSRNLDTVTIAFGIVCLSKRRGLGGAEHIGVVGNGSSGIGTADDGPGGGVGGAVDETVAVTELVVTRVLMENRRHEGVTEDLLTGTESSRSAKALRVGTAVDAVVGGVVQQM